MAELRPSILLRTKLMCVCVSDHVCVSPRYVCIDIPVYFMHPKTRLRACMYVCVCVSM